MSPDASAQRRAGGSAGLYSFVFRFFFFGNSQKSEIKGNPMWSMRKKRMCLKRHFSFDAPADTIEKWDGVFMDGTRLGKNNRRLDLDLSHRESRRP